MAETQIVKHSPVAKLEELAMSKLPSFEIVAPPGFDCGRMVKQAVVCVSKNPDLLGCTPESMMIALMQNAELGLDLAGGLPTAYLVPFKGKVVFMPSYRGLRELAIRSGTVKTIEAHPVYSGDSFDWKLTQDGLRFAHEFKWDARGDLVGFYALANLGEGVVLGERMSKGQVDAIRNNSPGKNSPAWNGNYIEMGRKTNVRRICKSLVLTPIMRRAIEIMDENEGGLPIDTEAKVLPPSTSASAIDSIPDPDEQPRGGGGPSGHQPPEPAAPASDEFAAEMAAAMESKTKYDLEGNPV